MTDKNKNKNLSSIIQSINQTKKRRDSSWTNKQKLQQKLPSIFHSVNIFYQNFGQKNVADKKLGDFFFGGKTNDRGRAKSNDPEIEC